MELENLLQEGRESFTMNISMLIENDREGVYP